MSALCATVHVPGCRRARRRHRKRLFALAFSHWWIQGTWPPLNALQRELLDQPEQFDVETTCANLPRAYGCLDDDDRLVLTVRGLRHVTAASVALADFMAVVRLAYERYRASRGDAAPMIVLRDLSDELQIPRERVGRVAQLLDGETGVFTRTTASDAAGAWEVQNAIYGYRNAHTVDEYVAVQRRQATTPSTRPRGRLANLRHRQQTPFDSVIIMVLGVVAAAALTVGIAYSPLGPSTPSPTTPAPVTPRPAPPRTGPTEPRSREKHRPRHRRPATPRVAHRETS